MATNKSIINFRTRFIKLIKFGWRKDRITLQFHNEKCILVLWIYLLVKVLSSMLCMHVEVINKLVAFINHWGELLFNWTNTARPVNCTKIDKKKFFMLVNLHQLVLTKAGKRNQLVLCEQYWGNLIHILNKMYNLQLVYLFLKAMHFATLLSPFIAHESCTEGKLLAV